MKLTNGKKKDLILDYIVKIHQEKRKGASSEEIKADLLPECTLDEINFLLREIELHEPAVIKMYFGITQSYVTKILYAKPFLDRGGFESIEKKETLKNRKDEFDFKFSKFQYYTFWPVFAFGLIGFGLSIFNFLHSQEVDKKATLKDKTELSIKKNDISETTDSLNTLNLKKSKLPINVPK